MSSASSQIQAFISSCSPVQDRVALVFTTYKFDSLVRVIHIYETVWTPLIDEKLEVHHVGRLDSCGAC